ncbi:hypothetical protein KSP40_PGU003810 [Platanthera guangdongensis]|uniref:Uncharacterized protein n=1 Tax=Platanthera guangdongensis TaxID=2320717 RepID=A0ABR2MLE3_9ASPA
MVEHAQSHALPELSRRIDVLYISHLPDLPETLDPGFSSFIAASLPAGDLTHGHLVQTTSSPPKHSHPDLCFVFVSAPISRDPPPRLPVSIPTVLGSHLFHRKIPVPADGRSATAPPYHRVGLAPSFNRFPAHPSWASAAVVLAPYKPFPKHFPTEFLGWKVGRGSNGVESARAGVGGGVLHWVPPDKDRSREFSGEERLEDNPGVD